MPDTHIEYHVWSYTNLPGNTHEIFDTLEDAKDWVELRGGYMHEYIIEKHIVELIDANYVNYN